MGFITVGYSAGQLGVRDAVQVELVLYIVSNMWADHFISRTDFFMSE